MNEEPIPIEIKQFILKSIDSIAQLEALLLLRGNQSEEWDTEKVAKRLYISEQETALLLRRLCDKEFIIANSDQPPRYQYQPRSTELRHMVNQVAEIYSKQLVPVTNLIHSKSHNRIQEFADAFRLRKDD